VSIRTLTQEDPIGLAGGLNLYGFAGGDPINFWDPFGLSAQGGDDDDKKDGFLKRFLKAQLKGFRAAFDPSATSVPEGGSFGFLLGKLSMVTGAPSASAARTVPAEATFFRGVSAAEAADVAATGTLRAGAAAAGNTGKYLTNSIGAAEAWGAMNGPGSQVLKITVAADATRAFTSLGRIDGIGQAWWAPIESLSGANIEVVKAISRVTVP
jgi:uncharacterized protein RhaS with RHS repeats